jgi:hypothetical protein
MLLTVQIVRLLLVSVAYGSTASLACIVLGDPASANTPLSLAGLSALR